MSIMIKTPEGYVGSIDDMPYFRATFRHGLQNPVYFHALDYEDARKRAFAHHLKNSDIEYFLPTTVDDVVAMVEQVG